MNTTYERGKPLFPFDVVLDHLGFNTKKVGENELIFNCPFCGAKRKIYADIQNGRFHCFSCDLSGGEKKFVEMLGGVSWEDLKRDVRQNTSTVNIQFNKFSNKDEKPHRDVYEFDVPYRALLSKLTLSKTHRQNLLNRGFTDSEINYFGYKTLPTDKKKLLEITKSITNEGIDVSMIPGFYYDEKEKSWTIIQKDGGFLIPVKSVKGDKILGMQIRLDKPIGKSKYLWFSSNPDAVDENGKQRYPKGTRASTYVHCTGNLNSGKAVYLTEGPLKADLAAAKTGKYFVALPGVNSTKFLLSPLKHLYSQYGKRIIVNAFDMDRLTNKNVMRALIKNQNLIMQSTKYRWQDFYWDNEIDEEGKMKWLGNYKGIDDYVTRKR